MIKLKAKHLYSKIFESKEKILERKTTNILNIINNLPELSIAAQAVLTSTGDFLLCDKNLNYLPLIMLKADDYGHSYSLVFNQFNSLTKDISIISELIKGKVSVDMEGEAPLAFDMDRKMILIGEAAYAYTNKNHQPNQGKPRLN